MKARCYFCKVWLNNPIPVIMYDGRTVHSCHVCRDLVADAKSIESDNHVLKVPERIELPDSANLEVRAR